MGRTTVCVCVFVCVLARVCVCVAVCCCAALFVCALVCVRPFVCVWVGSCFCLAPPWFFYFAALLYESPGGNQVDGLPPVLHTGVLVVGCPAASAKIYDN